VEKRPVAWYSRLLACLPSTFRETFGEEMAEVFARRIREGGRRGLWLMLRIFAGEVLALPGLWLVAHRRERRAAMTNSSRASTVADGPASWGATLAAALPLVAFTVSDVMEGPMRGLLRGAILDVVYNVLWADVIRAAFLPMVFHLLLLVGLLISWLKGFPRWSTPYLGWLVVVLIFGLGVPGLADPHLWRSWGAFLATLLLASLLRSPRKALRDLRDAWRRDWTWASFAALGMLQLMIWAGFDEMPGPRTLWRAISTTVLVACTVGVMRTRRRAARFAALLGSAALNHILSFCVMSYYWHGVQYPLMRAPIDGYEMFGDGLRFLAFTFVLLLVPALMSAALTRLFRKRSTG
jgi:hypothetical protein